MDCHLIAIKVRIESGTHERVYLNGLAFDKNGLKSLNT